MIDVAIVASKTAIKLPIGDIPRVRQTNGMGSDIVEEFHNCRGLGEADLTGSDGAGGEEFGGFTLEGMQGEEAEEAMHKGCSFLSERSRKVRGGNGLVEILDHEVLRVGGGETPEVDEKAVPRALLAVAVFQCFEGEMSGAPGEGVDDIAVDFEDVERGALLAAGEVGLQDATGVVVAAFSFQDRASGFKELIVKSSIYLWTGDLRISRPAGSTCSCHPPTSG